MLDRDREIFDSIGLEEMSVEYLDEITQQDQNNNTELKSATGQSPLLTPVYIKAELPYPMLATDWILKRYSKYYESRFDTLSCQEECDPALLSLCSDPESILETASASGSEPEAVLTSPEALEPIYIASTLPVPAVEQSTNSAKPVMLAAELYKLFADEITTLDESVYNKNKVYKEKILEYVLKNKTGQDKINALAQILRPGTKLNKLFSMKTGWFFTPDANTQGSTLSRAKAELEYCLEVDNLARQVQKRLIK